MNATAVSSLLLTITLYFIADMKTVVAMPVDSVFNALSQLPNDTDKVIKIQNYAQRIIQTDTSLSRACFLQAAELSKQLNNQRLINRSYNGLGILYRTMGQLEKAEYYTRKDLDGSYTPSSKGVAYSNLANLYLDRNQLEQATSYYLKAISQLVLAKDTEALTNAYSNISIVFSDLGNLKKAIFYNSKAIEYAAYSKDTGTIAIAYLNSADPLMEVGDYKQALQNSLLALEFAKRSGSQSFIYSQAAYQNIGDIYRLLKDYSNALLYADSCEKLAKKIYDEDELAGALTLFGKIYLDINEPQKARPYLLQTESLLVKTRDWETLRDAYSYLSLLEKQSSNWQKALFYFEKYDAYRDSFSNKEMNDIVAGLEMKYQTAQKEKRIILLENSQRKQQIIIVSLISSVVIVLLLSFFIWHYLSAKRRVAEQQIITLQREKQLEATQSLLQGEEQERSRLARDLHDGLGGILSSVKYSFTNMRESIILNPQQAESFANSVHKLDDSIVELRRIAQNMMPENLTRFGLDTSLRDLCSSISTDGKLKCIYQSFGMNDYPANSTLDLAVYRIAQEILHNTVKHAEATQAVLQLSFSDNKLLLTAEDNGKGFDTTILKTEKGSGFKSMQNRVNFLNGTLHIESNTKGTTVTIEIPT
jgi:signal transduction histidine kinase